MTKQDFMNELCALLDAYTDTDNMGDYEDISEQNGIAWSSGNEFDYEIKVKRTKHVADRRDI